MQPVARYGAISSYAEKYIAPRLAIVKRVGGRLHGKRFTVVKQQAPPADCVLYLISFTPKESSLAFQKYPSPSDPLGPISHSFYFSLPFQCLPFRHRVSHLVLGDGCGDCSALGDSPDLLPAGTSKAAAAFASILSPLDTAALRASHHALLLFLLPCFL